LPLVFAFVIPAVTMRLFSEEIQSGSLEILLTLPLTLGQIVAGKFAAGVVMTAAMLAPTLAYPISIAFIGDLDWGPVIGGYIGALLLGGSFAAVGLFASAVTRNQIIAFILGAAICLTLTLIDKMLFFFPPAVLNIIEYIGADSHFQNIAKGVIDSRDLVYFISVISIGLLGAHTVLLKKQ
ncbi:MAG: ABC transporter, partial [Desulfobacteraceae bacterium]